MINILIFATRKLLLNDWLLIINRYTLIIIKPLSYLLHDYPHQSR